MSEPNYQDDLYFEKREVSQMENDLCDIIQELFYFVKEARIYKDEYWYKRLKECCREYARAYPQWKKVSMLNIAMKAGLIDQQTIDEIYSMKWWRK